MIGLLPWAFLAIAVAFTWRTAARVDQSIDDAFDQLAHGDTFPVIPDETSIHSTLYK